MVNVVTTPIAIPGTNSSQFRSPLRYPGGKQKAIKQIAEMFPPRATEYREPMVGGGSVYFHARNTNFASKYWINDKFKELVTFWKIAQDPATCAQLQSELSRLRNRLDTADKVKKYFLAAREEQSNDEFRIAFLFFFFNRVTFSGTTRAGGFSSAASMSRFTISSIERLTSLPEALKDVRITDFDYRKVIDSPGNDVFLFLDPPYFTASKLYGRNGSLHEFDHEQLAQSLKSSTHKFLITYDDCPEIRKLYHWANVHEWKLQYGMNNCNSENLSKVGSELFICNYSVQCR